MIFDKEIYLKIFNILKKIIVKIRSKIGLIFNIIFVLVVIVFLLLNFRYIGYMWLSIVNNFIIKLFVKKVFIILFVWIENYSGKKIVINFLKIFKNVIINLVGFLRIWKLLVVLVFLLLYCFIFFLKNNLLIINLFGNVLIR